MPDAGQMDLINALLNWFVARGSEQIATVQRGRGNGCTPNASIAAEVLIAGNNNLFEELRTLSSWLIELFYNDIGGNLAVNEELIAIKCAATTTVPRMSREAHSEQDAEFFGALLRNQGLETVLTRFVQAYRGKLEEHNDEFDPFRMLLAAILLGLAWRQLRDRRISRETAQDLGTYLGVNGIIVGVSPVKPEQNSFWRQLRYLSDPTVLTTDFATTCFQLLFNRVPMDHEQHTFNSLLNLTVTNGPGTLSAKGAKESVSAGNHIATAYAGFMTNTGLAHGGNGFEAVSFMLRMLGATDPYQVAPQELEDVLRRLAATATQEFVIRKKQAKLDGLPARVPCLNHPVFRGKQKNVDPREAHLRSRLKAMKVVNPFLECYHYLAEELCAAGITSNIFCVNIDAALACIALDYLWKELRDGALGEVDAQEIVFTMFLYGRMAGVAAEIADHRARGLDLDCRTFPEELHFPA